MADKMAAAYQFAFIRCCGHFNLVILILISSNFHIWIASITLWLKFEYEFCPTNDSQNGRRLPIIQSHSLTPYLSHLLPDCFQISYMDYFIKLSPKFEYGLCQLTKMASKMAATYRFALVDTITWSFITHFLKF